MSGAESRGTVRRPDPHRSGELSRMDRPSEPRREPRGTIGARARPYKAGTRLHRATVRNPQGSGVIFMPGETTGWGATGFSGACPLRPRPSASLRRVACPPRLRPSGRKPPPGPGPVVRRMPPECPPEAPEAARSDCAARPPRTTSRGPPPGRTPRGEAGTTGAPPRLRPPGSIPAGSNWPSGPVAGAHAGGRQRASGSAVSPHLGDRCRVPVGGPVGGVSGRRQARPSRIAPRRAAASRPGLPQRGPRSRDAVGPGRAS